MFIGAPVGGPPSCSATVIRAPGMFLTRLLISSRQAAEGLIANGVDVIISSVNLGNFGLYNAVKEASTQVFIGPNTLPLPVCPGHSDAAGRNTGCPGSEFA